MQSESENNVGDDDTPNSAASVLRSASVPPVSSPEGEKQSYNTDTAS